MEGSITDEMAAHFSLLDKVALMNFPKYSFAFTPDSAFALTRSYLVITILLGCA